MVCLLLGQHYDALLRGNALGGTRDSNLPLVEDEERQAARLAQLRAMTSKETAALFDDMAKAKSLPRLRYHFERHGEDFNAKTPSQYERLFLAHIQQPDLRRLTQTRRFDASKMWYLIDGTSGAVAQYNESRRQDWSFFRPTGMVKYIESALGWSVEAFRTHSGWEFRPWLR